MRWRAFGCVASALLLGGGSGAISATQPFCEIHGPTDRAPPTIHRLRAGMSRADVQKILGEPDYSPARGQYYFATGGGCELEPGRIAPCGYVLEFGGAAAASGLVTCWWGAIGE